MPDDPVQPLVATIITEWGSLRQESLEAIERRVHVVVWGTTAYGALASAVAWLLGEDHDPVVFWLLVLVLPFQAFSTAILWLGEAKRSDRAGRHMSVLEADLDALLRGRGAMDASQLSAFKTGRPFVGLGWETFLRRQSSGTGFWKTAQLELPYFALAFYFVLMVSVPPILALYLAFTRWNQIHAAPIAALASYAVAFWRLWRWTRQQ
jgi:hypothetical protein